MSVPLPQMLNPGIINATISELNVINDRLQTFFIGGGGSAQQSGRNFSWDIYNDTREVESLRSPATGPARIAPNPVSTKLGVFPRAHSSIPLLYEQVHNLRKVGSMELDRSGETYIQKQERFLAQRYTNLREFMFMAMMRGNMYYTLDGDNLTLSLTSGTFSIDWQVPAGNKNQLDMLGEGAIIDASWDTSSTDIPMHLQKIDNALEVLAGRGLAHVFCNGYRWQKILANTKLQQYAGTANLVFDRWERVNKNDFVAVLRAMPWLTFHITNGVVSVGGTTTKLFGNDEVSFLPEPDPAWIQWMEGSEVVVEYPGATPAERFGTYFWSEPTTKPAGYELIGLMNGIPALYVPNLVTFADVTP